MGCRASGGRLALWNMPADGGSVRPGATGGGADGPADGPAVSVGLPSPVSAEGGASATAVSPLPFLSALTARG
jgi:hypothetical protein